MMNGISGRLNGLIQSLPSGLPCYVVYCPSLGGFTRPTVPEHLYMTWRGGKVHPFDRRPLLMFRKGSYLRF